MSDLHTRNCLSCSSEQTSPLALISESGIPSGQPGHEISYSRAIIALCNGCGSSYLEKFRHDCFDFEDVWNQYTWYVLDKPDTISLQTIIKDCPDPLSPECDCPIHHNLRRSCESLPTTYWSNGLESERSHVKSVSLSDILKP